MKINASTIAPNFSDIAILCAAHHPEVARGFCRTCNAERAQQVKKVMLDTVLTCTSCRSTEVYKPTALSSRQNCPH